MNSLDGNFHFMLSAYFKLLSRIQGNSVYNSDIFKVDNFR
jgi:hypothetical protein